MTNTRIKLPSPLSIFYGLKEFCNEDFLQLFELEVVFKDSETVILKDKSPDTNVGYDGKLKCQNVGYRLKKSSGILALYSCEAVSITQMSKEIRYKYLFPINPVVSLTVNAFNFCPELAFKRFQNE